MSKASELSEQAVGLVIPEEKRDVAVSLVRSHAEALDSDQRDEQLEAESTSELSQTSAEVEGSSARLFTSVAVGLISAPYNMNWTYTAGHTDRLEAIADPAQGRLRGLVYALGGAASWAQAGSGLGYYFRPQRLGTMHVQAAPHLVIADGWATAWNFLTAYSSRTSAFHGVMVDSFDLASNHTGVVLDNRYPLWDVTNDTPSVDRSGFPVLDGYAQVDTGHQYVIWYWFLITGSHTGEGVFGGSKARGFIEANLLSLSYSIP